MHQGRNRYRAQTLELSNSRTNAASRRGPGGGKIAAEEGGNRRLRWCPGCGSGSARSGRTRRRQWHATGPMHSQRYGGRSQPDAGHVKGRHRGPPTGRGGPPLSTATRPCMRLRTTARAYSPARKRSDDPAASESGDRHVERGVAEGDGAAGRRRAWGQDQGAEAGVDEVGGPPGGGQEGVGVGPPARRRCGAWPRPPHPAVRRSPGSRPRPSALGPGRTAGGRGRRGGRRPGGRPAREGDDPVRRGPGDAVAGRGCVGLHGGRLQGKGGGTADRRSRDRDVGSRWSGRKEQACPPAEAAAGPGGGHQCGAPANCSAQFPQR